MDRNTDKQPMNYIKLDFTVLIILFGILALMAAIMYFLMNAGPLGAQTNSPLDDTEYIFRTENYGGGSLLQVKLIGRSTVDGSVWTIVQDGQLVETENRIATSVEQSTYLELERDEIVQSATANLQGEFDPGENVSQWVANRTIELQSCQDDMVTGQTSPFNSLGNGAQNVTIARMQECIESNSKVLKKTINGLLDFLIAEGVVAPE